jgi:electron transport complex protein RnfG
VLKIKYFIQQSWLLIVASFCFGLLIAVTNAALSPRIQQNKINKLNSRATALLQQANDFIPVSLEIEINSPQGKKQKVTVYKAVSKQGDCVGWTFNASGPGFADKIELVVAVDNNFKTLSGFDCLASNETPGFGDQIKNDYYQNQFKDAPAEELTLVKSGDPKKIDAEIVAITGATVSSQSVINIINNSLIQIKQQLQQHGLIGNDKNQ